MADSPEQAPLGRKLLSSSGYLFITSILGGILGYAYSVAMGRMLGPQEYGLLGALMALVPILSVPVSTMNIAMARLFSRHLALHGNGDVRAIFWRNQLWLLGLGLCGIGAFALMALPLQKTLRSPGLLPVVFIGLNLFLMLLLPVANALAQARHHFGFIALLNVLGPLAKLVGSAAAGSDRLGRAGCGAGPGAGQRIPGRLQHRLLLAQARCAPEPVQSRGPGGARGVVPRAAGNPVLQFPVPGGRAVGEGLLRCGKGRVLCGRGHPGRRP